jgi:hypothetical protein
MTRCHSLVVILCLGTIWSFLAPRCPALTFSDWQASYFTPAELSDATVSGPEADPDGDSRANLLEYALGLDPWVIEPEVVFSQWGPNGFSLTFPEVVGADDLLYHFTESKDLYFYWVTPNTTSRTVLSENGTTRIVSVFNPNAPANPDRWFNRLRVRLHAGAPEPLFAPSGLSGTLEIPFALSLGWNDNARIETGYMVEKDSGSGFVPVADLAADRNRWLDEAVVGSTTYTYRVRARRGGSFSEASEFTITTPLDSDGDGVPDYLELDMYFSDPFNPDSDGDGMPDGWEVKYGFNPQEIGSPDDDFDGDGLSDLWEYRLGFDPTQTDSDGNGVPDAQEDSDGDGMPDGWEARNGLNPQEDDADEDPDQDGLSNEEELEAGTQANNPDTDGDGVRDGDDDFPLDDQRWKRVVDQNYALVLLPLPSGRTESWLHTMSDAGSVGGLLLGSAGLSPFFWSATAGTVDLGILPDQKTFSFYMGSDPPRTADASLAAHYWKVVSSGKAFGSIEELNLPGTGGRLPVMWTGHMISHGFDKMWLSGGFSGEIYAAAEPERLILNVGGRVGVLDMDSVIQAPGDIEYDLGDPEVMRAPNLSELDTSAGFGPDAGTISMAHPLHPASRHHLSPSGIYASGLNYVWQVGGAAREIKNPLPSNRDISQYEVRSLTDTGEAVGDLFALVTSSNGGALVCHDWRQLIPDDFKDQVATPPALRTPPDDEGGRAISPNGSLVVANFRHLDQQGVGSWSDEQSISTDQFILQRDGSGTWKLRRAVLPKDYLTSTLGITSYGVIYGTAKQIRNPDGTPIHEQNQVNRAAMLVPCDLAVDSNRDGLIKFAGNFDDPSVAGKPSDKTEEAKPFRFWCNDDDDHVGSKEEDRVPVMQPDSQDDQIDGRRDLEDFTRLHLYVGGLQDAIAAGSLQVGLEWRNTNGTNPAIKVYKAAENDGGDQYLTTELGAGQQILGSPATSLGTVNSSGGFRFPSSFWQANTLTGLTALSATNPNRYLLFEGVTEGKGQLVLTFWKGTEKIGEGPGVWLDLVNIRKMYQSSIEDEFDKPPTEEKTSVTFVHGWNMSPAGSRNFAESMFKRLWHRGFKGRFAYFRWNTDWSDAFDNAPVIGEAAEAYFANYNDSENLAWKEAGPALKAFVGQMPAGYTKNIAAHSMGNIVAGSALRAGMAVDNYAMMQAAVPSACYDDRELLKQTAPVTHAVSVSLWGLEVPVSSVTVWSQQTPDDDPDPQTRALACRGLLEDIGNNANIVNFYLSNDSATAYAWEINNEVTKPPGGVMTGHFRYERTNPAGQKLYRDFGGGIHEYTWLSRYDSVSFACRTWAKAVGAESRTRGSVTSDVDLGDASFHLPGEDPGSGFGNQHSGQFEANIQNLKPFYDALLDELEIPRNP